MAAEASVILRIQGVCQFLSFVGRPVLVTASHISALAQRSPEAVGTQALRRNAWGRFAVGPATDRLAGTTPDRTPLNSGESACGFKVSTS